MQCESKLLDWERCKPDGGCGLCGAVTRQPSNFTFGFLLLVNDIARIVETLLEDGVFEGI